MLAQGEHGAVTGQFASVQLPDATAQADLSVTVASAFLAQNMAEQAKPPSTRR